MNFAMIPARGGSKRINNKNIRDFNGKPIIAYSIETALASNLFDEVIVSTDCEQIAEVALRYGATVPFMRPQNIADDFATTREVINHSVEQMMQLHGAVGYCCCIYATAPMLQHKYLVKGLESLQEEPEKYFAFSVTEFAFPVQRALTMKNGALAALQPELRDTRSQDLPTAFHDAGQFYWGTGEAFLSDKELFSEHSIPIFLPPYLVQDIDTLDDWQRAEFMHKALSLQHS